MIKYVALYKKPADVADFDEKYFSSHLPIVEKTPGLLRAEVARVDRVLVPGFLGDTDLHVIAEMYFESADVMNLAFQSPEWHAAGANLSEIGGLELVAMFTAEVVAG